MNSRHRLDLRAATASALLLCTFACQGPTVPTPGAAEQSSALPPPEFGPVDRGEDSSLTTQDSRPAAPARPTDYTESIVGSKVGFDMVWVEEGGFWIGKFEVTWDEYALYCAFDEPEPVPPGADAVSKPSKPLETFPYDREWGMGRRPAVGMSWNAAKKYCEWVSKNTGHTYRLPTEAEWRLACGEAPEGEISDYAWYDDNSDDRTHEVGSKKPNAHGLYDMLGNLWEYTADPFDAKQPQFAALRGGSWADPAKDATPDARLAFDEFWILPDPNVPPGVWWVPDGDHLGFRLVRSGEGLEQGERGTP